MPLRKKSVVVAGTVVEVWSLNDGTSWFKPNVHIPVDTGMPVLPHSLREGRGPMRAPMVKIGPNKYMRRNEAGINLKKKYLQHERSNRILEQFQQADPHCRPQSIDPASIAPSIQLEQIVAQVKKALIIKACRVCSIIEHVCPTHR